MDFPLDIDTMGLPILYFKESHVEVSKEWRISVPEGFLILANSTEPDIWVFTVCQNTCLKDSSIQRVNRVNWLKLKKHFTFVHVISSGTYQFWDRIALWFM